MKTNPFTRSCCSSKLAALLTLAFVSGQLWAQDPQVNFTVRGRWPGFQRGPAQAVAVQGHYVFVGNAVGPPDMIDHRPYGGILIFDITNPAKPVWRSAFDAGRPVTSLTIAGHYLYATRDDTGLVILDITQPEKPVIAGVLQSGYSSQYYPHRVQVSGNYAYLECGDALNCEGGLEVVDIRNPAQPAVQGRLGIPAQLGSLEVSGNYVYVGSGEGLWIIDVSDPTQPVCVNHSLTRSSYEVHVRGNYAYLMQWSADLLVVLDVSNPTNPTPVNVCFTNISGMEFAGTNLYAVTAQGLQVFDISDPTRLVWVGKCEGPGLGPYQVAGDYAYAVWDGMLQVVDLANPAHPVRLDSSKTKIEGDAVLVRVLGNRAYLADIDSLHVIDVSNPAQPLLLGSVKASSMGLWCIALDAARPYVYAAEVEAPWNSFFTVFDVSNPAAPARIAKVSAPQQNNIFRIRSAAELVYVARYQYPSVKCFDVSNPAQPLETSGLLFGDGGAPGISVTGSYLYASYAYDNGDDFFSVIDVGTPANPVVAGSATIPGGGSAVHAVGRYAYVSIATSTWGGLDVFDVSDPAMPFSVGVCNLGSWRPAWLQVEGQYAYLAGDVATTGGHPPLRVIDVRDPTQPRLLDGAYEILPGNSYDEPFQVVGNLIYLADANGLTILEAELPGTLKLNPPVLSGNTLTLSWNGGAGIKLQKTLSLSAPDWRDVPDSEGFSQIELPCAEAAAFFRLTKP